MEALKENPKIDVNGWVRKNVLDMPSDSLVTVDQGIRSNGIWKSDLSKAGPALFLAATMALVVWVVGALLFVTVYKRREYRDEINQRLFDVTRMSIPRMSSVTRKTCLKSIPECRKMNSKPQLGFRSIGG